MILKRSGTTRKLLRENPAFSFTVKKLPKRGVSSSSFSRTRRPSVLAEESNLMALALACDAAFSRGGTRGLVHENIPLGGQAQGEKFEAEQNRQGGYLSIHA